jgi:methyltransferase FkbM-like protein
LRKIKGKPVAVQNKHKSLKSFETNVNSQYGEDGVTEEILARLGKSTDLDKWCVEFGAWDGLHLSNTCRLIQEVGYSAVLIEGNPAKYKELCKNFPQTNIVKLCEFVDFKGQKSLENILLGTDIPKEFDFLSIDIDGNDYHILASLSEIRPKLICIEFNSHIPNEVEFVQKADFKINVGSSAKSLILLAQEKGYDLVHATQGNLFFVRGDLTERVVGDERPQIEEIIDDTDKRTFIFVGMDGSLHTSQTVWMPWHKLAVTEAGIQALPAHLIRFRSDYNIFQKISFYTYRWLSRNVKKEKRR